MRGQTKKTLQKDGLNEKKKSRTALMRRSELKRRTKQVFL
jgi:hypothetical protein